jgi:hypothetical protein
MQFYLNYGLGFPGNHRHKPPVQIKKSAPKSLDYSIDIQTLKLVKKQFFNKKIKKN